MIPAAKGSPIHRKNASTLGAVLLGETCQAHVGSGSILLILAGKQLALLFKITYMVHCRICQMRPTAISRIAHCMLL